MVTLIDFSVTVFTPVCFHQRLALCFHDAAVKFIESTKGKCHDIQINMASTLEQLVDFGVNAPDFVAYFVDTNDANLEGILRRQWSQMSGPIATTRLILVNATCRSGPYSAACKLIEIADHFQVPIMNAEVEDKESCRRTAEKIIALAAKVSGFQFGYPVVIPTVNDFEKPLGT